MSLSDLNLHQRAVSAIAAVACCMTLTGCVQPLYGTLGDGVLEKELQAIKVEEIDGHIGHYLADDLMFGFNGSSAVVQPKYRLVVKLKEDVRAPVVDTVAFRATSATLVTDAEFALTPIDGDMPIIRGAAFAVASYDRTSQRVSNVRAARDAEIRDAKTIAEQIRTQISARLASRS